MIMDVSLISNLATIWDRGHIINENLTKQNEKRIELNIIEHQFTRGDLVIQVDLNKTK